VLPLTVEVEVVAATQADFNVLGTLNVTAGPYSSITLRDTVNDAVEAFFLSKDIGSTVHPSEIIGAVYAAVPEGCFRSCTLVQPASETVLSADENPRMVGFDMTVVIS